MEFQLHYGTNGGTIKLYLHYQRFVFSILLLFSKEIKLKFYLFMLLPHEDDKSAQGLYNIPKNAIVEDVGCDYNSSQLLQVNWGPSSAQHSMTLQFERTNGTINMTMIMFNLPLLSTEFPNAKGKWVPIYDDETVINKFSFSLENQTINLVHRGFDFSAPIKMSYHCTRPQVFNLTETIVDKQVTGTVKVHDVQVEAFRKSGSTAFSTARDCDSTETPDVVPIAVGFALAALIAIVLISYLCARRRSTSRGYMSF